MKTTFVFSLLIFSLAVFSQTTQQPTVREQLENLNSYWKQNSVNDPVLQESIPLNADVTLIKMHLSLVEKTLRKKEATDLSLEQRDNRNHCLDILHDYWTNGVFPINTGHKERTPYFIDNFGTACAVGQLMISTGFENVAKKIHSENNFAYVRDLNAQYPELKLWADAYGFEVDELAWIQPTYGCTSICAPGEKRNVSCYGYYDGCAGNPNISVGSPPYVIIPQMWYNGQWFTPANFNGLCDLPAGLYRHLVKDAVNDTFYFEYTITQPDSISISTVITPDDGSCNGAIDINVSGGTPPYSYQWNGSTPGCSGTYFFTVTDSNGCSKSDSVTIPFLTTSVTHGPIIGGVTPTTARVFVRTETMETVDVQFSTQSNFAAVAKTFSGQTIGSRDTSVILDASGLQPDTRYFVRAMINGVETGKRATFKTFPTEGTEGNYKFLYGSCIYELMDTDSSLFKQMLTEDANLFTPTGDWGYPDRVTGANDLYLSNPPKSWASDYSKVAAIYKERYARTNSGFFYSSIAMDYTHDDHDYLNDNTGRDHANIFEINPIGGKFGEPKSVSQPPQARLNCIKGYQEFFPSYPLVDSNEGIFHSYRMGNCEFFVLDLRSARTSQHEAIKEVGGEWMVQEPAGHSIMGQVQREWLFNGLQNSTADWKFIISSVVFNKGYKAAMDSLLKIGKGVSPILGIDVSGIQLSTGLIGVGIMSDSWVGFPSDQDALLDLIEINDIKNVFVVSGDAHTAALDDGTNSGIPELLAANLKKSNSEDAVVFSNFLGYWVWNKGASGLSTTNLNNTYGKVEVFGKDSVRLSAVDANGEEVVGHTFMYEQKQTGIRSVNETARFNVYPNPVSNKLFIESLDSKENFDFILISASGKEVLRKKFLGKGEVETGNIPAGFYFYRIVNEKNSQVADGKIGVTK